MASTSREAGSARAYLNSGGTKRILLPMTSGRQWCLNTDDRQARSARPETMEIVIMRKLMATVFNYSLDGLLADEGTEFWKFCFGLPENREPDDPAHLDFLRSAYAHIMGRTAYEAIAESMTATST